jgi:hypothetical protein
MVSIKYNVTEYNTTRTIPFRIVYVAFNQRTYYSELV